MVSFFSRCWYYTKNLKYLFQAKCVVLIYHRVKDLELDAQMLAVSPAHFEKQIEYLKTNYKILSLQELIGCLNKKRIPNKSIVITFDDGYADNLYQAAPILVKYNTPATIFISSGMIDSGLEFWWDSLEYIFLAGVATIKKKLEIKIAGINYNWNIEKAEDATMVYHKIQVLIKSLPITERDEKIDELYIWSGLQKKQRTSHAILLKEELEQLSQLKCIEIGAHTIVHPRLENETINIQEHEIVGSKTSLENMIGKKVVSFSYPFGAEKDFSNASVRIVKGAGYNCGLANIQDEVTKITDVYKIPRRLVRNWGVEEFESNLKMFFRKPESWVDFFKNKISRV